jgi:hypothetical protein
LDIVLTLTLDEDDLVVVDLFDPESGERSVKAIPHVSNRNAGLAQPVDMFGTIERGQDVLDSLEDMDEESSEVGGDEATEEIGLPFDDIEVDDEVTESVESLFVDEESAPEEPAPQTDPANTQSAEQPDGLLKDLGEDADFDFGNILSEENEYVAEPVPPVSDTTLRRVRYVGIAVVILLLEVLIACFITIRPRLVSDAGVKAHGNYIVSSITPSPRS